MKKIKLTFLLMSLAILALSSCNDNSSRLTVSYNITLSDDMAQIADLAITYKGDDGKTVTDTITSKVWDKTIHIDTFPSQFGLVDYTFIPKPGSQLKKETCKLEAVFSIYAWKNNFGLEYNLVSPFTLKQDKVSSFLDIVNDHGAQSLLVTATDNNGTIKFAGQGKQGIDLLIDDEDDWQEDTIMPQEEKSETDSIATK